MNLMIAIAISISLEQNTCVWYFINMMTDCTVGVFFAFCLLKIVQRLAIIYDLDMLKTGHYSEKYDGTIDLGAWALQLIIWNCIVATAKTILGLMMFFTAE
jgi:hypothetical protein